MKQIIVLTAILLFTFQLSVAQTIESDSLADKSAVRPEKQEWQIGLHAGPLLSGYKDMQLIGYTLFPGIYRTSGRLMYGFTPFYRRTDYSYQATSNIPENMHHIKINSYGGMFQVRYFLNNKKLSPYILLQTGFSYNQEVLNIPPVFGESISENYWEFNVGTGFGATYKINDRWTLDGNIRLDLLLSPEREYDFSSDWTFGVFYRIGK